MIHHVTVPVAAALIHRCQAFYELLGFVPVAPPESLRERAVWLELGATQVHLERLEDGVPRHGHFACVIERYAETLAALRKSGHPVDERREHWGSPRCFARDPAGNVVELMAFPPPAE